MASQPSVPPPSRERSWRAAGPPNLGRAVGGLLAMAVGVLLGVQYWFPNKRVVPVLVGIVLSGIAWRLRVAEGLGILALALPYPRGTVFGNTNLAFILLLLVFWFVRISLRQTPPPRRTPVDLPIVALFISYVVSFHNVTNATNLTAGLQNFELFIACLCMFYLIVNNVRTSADLVRLHQYQMVGALSVFLLAIYELNHPASPFIRGWLDFTTTVGSEFNEHNIRVGASFHDYELLAEFCGLMLLLGVFLLARARTLLRRTLLSAFLILNVFVLFTTVTRGGFIALGVAVPWLLFQLRRRIRFQQLVMAAGAAALLGVGMNAFVAGFTRSGDVFARLSETKVVNGWVPDSRAGIWQNAFQRALVHPLIGQGPCYAPLPPYENTWPHNVYLYFANIVGFVGLAFFLLLLVRLWGMTRAPVDDLRHERYADAYLVIARAQLLLFIVDEVKIDYLRNPIYQFEVWFFFGVWAAAGFVSRAERAEADWGAAAVGPARAAA